MGPFDRLASSINREPWSEGNSNASDLIVKVIFIIIDVLTADAANPITGVAVALIVGTTNITGAVANFANGFTTTPPSDTYLEYAGEYGDFDTSWTAYMQTAILNLWRLSDGSIFSATAVNNGPKGRPWPNRYRQKPTTHLPTSISLAPLLNSENTSEISDSNIGDTSLNTSLYTSASRLSSL